MKRKILEEKFFERAAPVVAVDLIGKYLVRKFENGEELASMITETEAYEGLDDLASHASKGKTPRTEIMFGPAGVLYIYLVYGMHYMLNVVTGPRDHPAAVLIRGTQLVSGPGRVAKNFLIDKNFNTKKIGIENNIWFEDRGENIDPKAITPTPRIGVDYAGPIWAKKEWRFVLNK